VTGPGLGLELDSDMRWYLIYSAMPLWMIRDSRDVIKSDSFRFSERSFDEVGDVERSRWSKSE
jgi:hypothetical protein